MLWSAYEVSIIRSATVVAVVAALVMPFSGCEGSMGGGGGKPPDIDQELQSKGGDVV